MSVVVPSSISDPLTGAQVNAELVDEIIAILGAEGITATGSSLSGESFEAIVGVEGCFSIVPDTTNDLWNGVACEFRAAELITGPVSGDQAGLQIVVGTFLKGGALFNLMAYKYKYGSWVKVYANTPTDHNSAKTHGTMFLANDTCAVSVTNGLLQIPGNIWNGDAEITVATIATIPVMSLGAEVTYTCEVTPLGVARTLAYAGGQDIPMGEETLSQDLVVQANELTPAKIIAMATYQDTIFDYVDVAPPLETTTVYLDVSSADATKGIITLPDVVATFYAECEGEIIAYGVPCEGATKVIVPLDKVVSYTINRVGYDLISGSTTLTVAAPSATLNPSFVVHTVAGAGEVVITATSDSVLIPNVLAYQDKELFGIDLLKGFDKVNLGTLPITINADQDMWLSFYHEGWYYYHYVSADHSPGDTIDLGSEIEVAVGAPVIKSITLTSNNDKIDGMWELAAGGWSLVTNSFPTSYTFVSDVYSVMMKLHHTEEGYATFVLDPSRFSGGETLDVGAYITAAIDAGEVVWSATGDETPTLGIPDLDELISAITDTLDDVGDAQTSMMKLAGAALVGAVIGRFI